MWSAICALFGALWLIRTATCAGNCYSQFCKNTSLSVMDSQWRTMEDSPQCLLTSIQNTSDCMRIKFHEARHTPPPGVAPADVELSAYVYHERGTKTTAFNLTIYNINFKRLTTRYQERGDPASSYCRHISFYTNDESQPGPSLFVSCPFASTIFEERSYWLEYLITHQDYEYSRQLLFNVPSHHYIGDRLEDPRTYVPFIYADISGIPQVSLYIQALPRRFNISTYRIWIINNATGTSETLDLPSLDNVSHIKQNISMNEGTYHVYVAAIHSICEDGCINSTLPMITVKQPTRRILIMIISVVWIPPVILYAVYYIYKMYKRKDLLKVRRRPKCLLVYSPTHMAHVNVASTLAKYLRSCNVDAMIDVLDIQQTAAKDPGHWCNEAFRSSETIVVLASPALSTTVPIIYKNMDNHALRLLKENYSCRNKHYISIELPYCTADEIPEEARLFKKFRLPENLDKLVKYLHNGNFARCSSGNHFLIDSINIAMSDVPRERQQSPSNIDETDGLLPPKKDDLISELVVENDKKTEMDDTSQHDKHEPQPEGPVRHFGTNIHELNLLGESNEPQGDITYQRRTNGDFQIDELDL